MDVQKRSISNPFGVIAASAKSFVCVLAKHILWTCF